MHVTTETHGNLACEIEANEAENQYTGTLKYNSFDIGQISSADLAAVRSQFQTIVSLVDEGAQVRHGIIVCGYHGDALQGDVLRVDGDVLGSWRMDDEEWCDFTADGAEGATCSAPSLWLLHDKIGKWREGSSQ